MVIEGPAEVLHDRRVEREVLGRLLEAVRGGQSRVLVVSGQPGVGKTALVEAFQERSRGTRWLWGACDGLLTPRPLGPLFDIGARLDGELGRLCRDGAPRDRLFAAFLAEILMPAFFTRDRPGRASPRKTQEGR